MSHYIFFWPSLSTLIIAHHKLCTMHVLHSRYSLFLSSMHRGVVKVLMRTKVVRGFQHVANMDLKINFTITLQVYELTFTLSESCME